MHRPAKPPVAAAAQSHAGQASSLQNSYHYQLDLRISPERWWARFVLSSQPQLLNSLSEVVRSAVLTWALARKEKGAA